MNLYKVKFTHVAPKGSAEGIKTFLLAENDLAVYYFIDKEYNYDLWRDRENDEEAEPIEILDDDYNVIGTKPFKQHIIDIKGDMNDEDYDYSDAYYGITLYGWELVKESVSADFSEMIELGIIETTP